jgi:hypothetical protein
MNSSFLVLQGRVGVKLIFGETIPFVGLPREACKSNLADAICGGDCTHEIDGEGFQYVLDGGSLLQRIHGHMVIRLDQ